MLCTPVLWLAEAGMVPYAFILKALLHRAVAIVGNPPRSSLAEDHPQDDPQSKERFSTMLCTRNGTGATYGAPTLRVVAEAEPALPRLRSRASRRASTLQRLAQNPADVINFVFLHHPRKGKRQTSPPKIFHNREIPLAVTKALHEVGL